VYTSTPAGLSINSTTGAIIPSTSTAGTYTVTYSIASSNGCGVYNVLTSVTITAQPSATISYSGSPYCRTLTTAQPVTRTGTAGGIYTSIPTSLFINSSTGAITPSASTAGTYTVNYTVAASNGCASYTAPSTSVTITAQPSAAISYPSSSYCMSLTTAQPVIRTGTTGGAYSSIPAGLSINSATGAITPSASTAGSYNVNYTIAASNGCGAVTAPTSVTITALPTATISYSGSPFCRTLTTAQPVNRTGATNGTFTSSPAGLSINSISGAITPSLSQVGTYTVFYSVPASSGCATTTFSCSVVISSTLPVGNIAPASGNICEGSTLTLTASGGYLYNWYKNGIVIAGATNSTYQAGTSGTYTVQVFSTNGCNAMGSNSSILTYTKKPIANFSYNNYCIRKPILFTSTSDTINSRPVTYRWSFGDGVGTSTLKNPTYTFMNAGTYNVSLTVRSVLCPSLQSQSIKTIKIDTFIANLRYPNVNVVIPPGIQLTAREFTTNTTYSWSPTTGLNSPSIYNPFFNINTPQQYLITITNPSGCIIKDTLKVNVFTTQDIFVPKGFSPNNDGANDKLFPYIVGLRALNYFQVYNRWGQKVFETNIEGNGWDGKYRGVIQPIETYTWIAEGVGLDGKIVKRSGGTLLMR
jgi:gliding motility-associated-like protein